MGVYTVPELLVAGYQVDVLSMDDWHMANQNVRYIQANGLDDKILKDLLEENRYDAIIDFMLYQTEVFARRLDLLLTHTSHYIFLSTYRVYSSVELPIRETSPRMLDIAKDEEYLSHEGEEYSLYKARQEDLLQHSPYRNWTIVRPAITFSKLRYQLVTLEAHVLIRRAMEGKVVVLPESAMDVQATMSWAGDVAKLFARLVLNPKAYGETFSLCTGEHHTWREIAEYYREIIGLKYRTVDTQTYLNIRGLNGWSARYQLFYDRCLDRIMDNRKVLEVTGLTQEDMVPVKDALTRELANLPSDHSWPHSETYTRMDAWLAGQKE